MNFVGLKDTDLIDFNAWIYKFLASSPTKFASDNILLIENPIEND